MVSGNATVILACQLNISRQRTEARIMEDGVALPFPQIATMYDSTNAWNSIVYTCQKTQPKRCDFFLWDDEAKGREAAAVLHNSRTEPLPSPSPQTPQKPSPYGLATPQTSSRLRLGSPDVATPYTPSKVSPDVPSAPAPGSATQATTTQGSDSEEEFYDWPASDDDALSKVADQASSGHSMPPPETPRKAMKTDALATPGKRRYDEMAAENVGHVPSGWPTPSTGAAGGDVFTTPSTNKGKGLFANAILPSPAETPTPIRYRDIPPTQDSELASEVLKSLESHDVSLPVDSRDAVKSICNKHVLYTKGIMKGRDVSRAMVRRKDERIAELQGEIEGLKAERETNRAVIRHLRRDMAVRKETRR